MTKKSLSLKIKITLGVTFILIICTVGFSLFGTYALFQHDSFSNEVISGVFDNVRMDNEAFQTENTGREIQKITGMQETVDFVSGDRNKSNEAVLRGFFITLAKKSSISRFLLLDRGFKIIFSEQNRELSKSDDAVYQSGPMVNIYQKVAETWNDAGLMVDSGGTVCFAVISVVVNDDDETVGFAVCEIPASVLAVSFAEKVKGEIAFQGSADALSGSSSDRIFSLMTPEQLAVNYRNGNTVLRSGKDRYRLYSVSAGAGDSAFGFSYWVALDYKNAYAAGQRLAVLKLVVFIGILAAGVLSLYVFLSRQIRPLKEVVLMLKDIAGGEGDLTRRIKIKSGDEIGSVAKWFNVFVERLERIVLEIGRNSETVTGASDELLKIAGQMSESADDLSVKANAVTHSSEELSINMNSVAAASEEALANISVVADSASGMKSALGRVADNCAKAKDISGTAETQVENASRRVADLGNAAREISRVTRTITEIADRTGILALNATIEAARSGEAGRGFAVVAGEIKALAGQTAEATEDIRSKIEAIQSSTENTVRDVTGIFEVISDVNDIVIKIAESVEEQSAGAAEVALNIAQASEGLSEVNENVAKSSSVFTEIASDISGVNSVADGISVKSGQTHESAENLTDLSLNLKDMISVFKVSERTP